MKNEDQGTPGEGTLWTWYQAWSLVKLTPQSAQQPPDGGLLSPRVVSLNLGEHPNKEESDKGTWV